MPAEVDPFHGKVSQGLAARLPKLSPRQKVRAVLLLRPAATGGGSAGRRQSATERQAAVAAARAVGQELLPDINAVLERTNGRRLADAVSVLGTLPVEVTKRGIRELAGRDDVQAILEDQPTRPLSPPAGPREFVRPR